MKLSSAAVLGLVPVPPMPVGQDSETGTQNPPESGLQPAAERNKGSSDQASRRGNRGRVAHWLSIALNGLFAIALAVGPFVPRYHCLPEKPLRRLALANAGAADAPIISSAHVRPLRPVTFGMQPSNLTKVALTAPPDFKSVRIGPAAKPAEVVIDVIVAYTRNAASHYANIERKLVHLAIEEANESFRASNLGHIKLRLVHAYQTDYVEEGAHFDHVWRFADKGDGYMEEIHGLRDRYRADVAILIVDDAKGCGLATRVQADGDEAFAVVHHECAVANYSLAHEIGHLIGARHELGYVNGTKWRDIMSYKAACDGCPRVAVWSSPMVLINGEPAGTTELNNARIIAEQAPRVAAFR